MKYMLSEIARICGGELIGEDLPVARVLTDSRNCSFGEEPLFVAMKGTNHDSHAFIGEMVRRDVKAFLAERKTQLPAGCGCVVVPSAIAALQQLAAHHRTRFKGRVVGITGSNGKTVVKEWIAQQIPAGVKYFRSPKSYNSQLGVALSLLMIEGDEELALIEAGISCPGEMVRLERMIRPDTVIFTSIGEAHQENFTSLEEKSAEKLVLAKGARTIIYHGGSSLLERMIRTLYGGRQLQDAAEYPLPEQLPAGVLESGAGRVDAQLVGAFCRVMGFPDPDFGRIRPVAMRLELKEGINGSLLIDDAYNSDINSLSIALDYLHNMAAGRPMTLILSDIEQSGVEDGVLYGEVARLVAAAGVSRLIGVGDRIRNAGANFACDSAFYRTTDELLRNLRRDDVAGRVVLIKGSRDSHFERVSHALERKSHTTVLEVDLDAMIHNLNYFRARLRPGVRLVAMVKAASYGAGDFEVAQMLQHQGVNYLAVAFADEGVLLRERGIRMPIVVLNADEGSFDLMVAHRLEPEIYNFRSLAFFSKAVERVGEESYPIHIKLDTGMHRLGFMEGELDMLTETLGETPSVKVATIFSHLNCSDMPQEDRYTREQIARFDRMSGRLAAALPYPVLRHTANSAAIERFPEAQFDMCRLGLGLYGFGFEHNDELKPVSTLKSRIVQLKHLSAGEAVGYGRAGKLTRDSVTATVPMGYADGLDRHLGCGRWSMLVAGRPAPIVGRVCMDSCMIDVTDIPGVEEGDEVVIFSAVPGNTPEDMAQERKPGQPGTLYLIPCPIAEDTPVWDVLPAANRAVIDSLDYFIVENVRSARRFLSKAGFGRPIDSLEFRELNEHTTDARAVDEMVRPILAGRSAGVISEAGVPGVADPGALAVARCHRLGIRVVPLIGPSSIILAVMASGLNGQSFAFNGYLPVKPPERARAIRTLERRATGERQSQVFIEAPYRNAKLLGQLLEVCAPDTRLTLAVDITSPQEYIRTLTVREWRSALLPEMDKRPAIFILG